MAEAAVAAEAAKAVADTGMIAVAAGLAIAGGALATGFAQASIGAAAVGVMAEKPEQMGTLLLFLVLPETLVIFGFVISIMLTLKVA